jgi:poly-gamma-glutamate capsule biosynthesis protein CapA/YwtB (metallophosphatase superfamily)
MTLFLCGDVMTGRGVDQILGHPSGHYLYEAYVQDAREYVRLAELRNGSIPKPVADTYIWGDALTELERIGPDVRVVNLETSVTTSDDYWPGKGINYRMHPENIGCLTVARIDVCAMANNHVLDYGYVGLRETLATLDRAGLKKAGAGADLSGAQAPAIVPLTAGGRVLVVSFGTETSGIPATWVARAGSPGVNVLPDLDAATAIAIANRVRRASRDGDIVIASIHWGTNWGYDVPRDHVRFAHALVDGGIDLVHGHSSHHPRPIEVYKNRLILYGCGDFINDYEGIEGYEQYRGDLTLMYFPTLSGDGQLTALRMTPMQIRQMRLNQASADDTRWLRDTLERVSAPMGAHADLASDHTLALRW